MINTLEEADIIPVAGEALSHCLLSTLEDIATGRATIVDLTYSLNENTNFWPGDDYEPFTLETIATLEKDGVLSKAMRLPEHIGTHIDAPNHFEPNQPSVDQIEPRD